MRYPGGKGRSFPQILNLIPSHSTYVETHLGGGAVMRHKAPSVRQVGIDRDPAVIGKWCEEGWKDHCELILGDATEWLRQNKLEPTACIYADPPYLPSTRRQKKIYRCEYTEDDHVELLTALRASACNVMVSGYKSSLYEELLTGWNTRSFFAASHAGLREETIWFNYEPPAKLHDARYLGEDFRARERIRRKRARLEKTLSRLTPPERHSLYEWLGSNLNGIES